MSNSNLPSLFRLLWTLPERLFIRSTGLVITVSDLIANELGNIYHIERPAVILNCPERSIPRVSRRLREELAISGHRPIVLYQGGVSANRGLHTLIAGTMRVADAVAVIVGSGHYSPLMRATQRSFTCCLRMRCACACEVTCPLGHA
jgi:hypothetical protein